MKRQVLVYASSTIVTLATAGLVYAQDPPPRDPAKPNDPTRQDPRPTDPTRQEPRPTDTTRPSDTPRTQSADEGVVKVTGCLKQEKDVPERKPNVAERAALGEDFILTNAKVSGGAVTAASASSTKGMFKIDGLDDERLRKHINQQVEVQGTVDDNRSSTGRTTTPPASPDRPSAPGTGTDAPAGTTGTQERDELPEINATSIRMVSASCTTGTY